MSLVKILVPDYYDRLNNITYNIIEVKCDRCGVHMTSIDNIKHEEHYCIGCQVARGEIY
jgi:formamidopyrimidine-DNA glycosylase